MKKVLWILVFLFVSCTTLTENEDNGKQQAVSVQFDDNGGAGEGNGATPPKPPGTGG